MMEISAFLSCHLLSLKQKMQVFQNGKYMAAAGEKNNCLTQHFNMKKQ